MRRLSAVSVLLAGVLSMAFSGCSRDAGSVKRDATDGARPLVLAVIPKGTTHEFWKSIHAGARQAAAEAGVELIWKGPLKEDDREQQIAVVEQMITRRVDGIVLAPLDDAALRAPVLGASRAGIPVVIMDSGLQGSDFVSFVATDNRLGGRLGGRHLAALLGAKGRVVMLRYQVGSASTMEREQGFLEAMAECPEIQVISANQYGGATTESAYQASENLLAPLRAEGGVAAEGIFCPNESTTFGMLRALQDAGLAGRVKFVGFDSSEKLVQALERRELHGLVLQNPVRMGALSVRTLVAHLRGEPIEARVDTGVLVATPETMGDPEVAGLLNPALE